MTKEEAIKTLEKSMECHDRKVCGITEDCDECPLYADKDMEYEAHKVLLECLKESDELLNKIRAEIEAQREKVSKKHSDDEALDNYYFGLNDGLKDARDIYDKYKTEREE